jgi:hypothetical protein
MQVKIQRLTVSIIGAETLRPPTGCTYPSTAFASQSKFSSYAVGEWSKRTAEVRNEVYPSVRAVPNNLGAVGLTRFAKDWFGESCLDIFDLSKQYPTTLTTVIRLVMRLGRDEDCVVLDDKVLWDHQEECQRVSPTIRDTSNRLHRQADTAYHWYCWPARCA